MTEDSKYFSLKDGDIFQGKTEKDGYIEMTEDFFPIFNVNHEYMGFVRNGEAMFAGTPPNDLLFSSGVRDGHGRIVPMQFSVNNMAVGANMGEDFVNMTKDLFPICDKFGFRIGYVKGIKFQKELDKKDLEDM